MFIEQATTFNPRINGYSFSNNEATVFIAEHEKTRGLIPSSEMVKGFDEQSVLGIIKQHVLNSLPPFSVRLFIQRLFSKEWNGVCYGMCASVLKYWQERTIWVYKLRLDDCWEYLYGAQTWTELPLQRLKNLVDWSLSENLSEFSKLQESLKTHGPTILILWKRLEEENEIAHAVVAYDIRYHSFFKKPCVYIYDPNYPNQERSIIVGKDGRISSTDNIYGNGYMIGENCNLTRFTIKRLSLP